jgi:hypothetical protein
MRSLEIEGAIPTQFNPWKSGPSRLHAFIDLYLEPLDLTAEAATIDARFAGWRPEVRRAAEGSEGNSAFRRLISVVLNERKGANKTVLNEDPAEATAADTACDGRLMIAPILGRRL